MYSSSNLKSVNKQLKIKSTLKRFLKVFLGSSFGAMATIVIGYATTHQLEVLNDLPTFINALATAGIAGGISGVVLAGQKWFSWTDI